MTEYFIDAEVPRSDMWFGCVDSDTKERFTLMMFYFQKGNTTHEIMYRRALDVSECLEIEKEYQRMTAEAKTIRIVGSHPRSLGKDEHLPSTRIPKQFSKPENTVHWTFQRLQVGDKCKAYFSDDCDLPKNYWADTIPPKATSPAK